MCHKRPSAYNIVGDVTKLHLFFLIIASVNIAYLRIKITFLVSDFGNRVAYRNTIQQILQNPPILPPDPTNAGFIGLATGVKRVCDFGKMKNDMQKTDNCIGWEARGLLNKKRETRKLLFVVIQPILPDWLQLLMCQYFTRVYLSIYNKLLNKKRRLHFITILVFTGRFTKQVTTFGNRSLPMGLFWHIQKKKNDSRVAISDTITRCTEQVTTLNLSVNYRNLPYIYGIYK